MLNTSINGEPPPRNGSRTVRFGVFEADLHSGEVRKSGNRVKLQDQPFKVLQILLERPGDLVSREELQTRIWPEETYGDFDHAVNVAVGKLRTALGDSADNPSYIETVPRRGYRFVAPLERAQVEPPPPPPAEIVVAPAEVPSRGRKLVLAGLLALIVCGILVALGVWLRTPHRPFASIGLSASDSPPRHRVFRQVCPGWTQRRLQRLLGRRAHRDFLHRPENPGPAERRHPREPSTRCFLDRRNGSFAGGPRSFHVHLPGNTWPGAVDRRLATANRRGRRRGRLVSRWQEPGDRPRRRWKTSASNIRRDMFFMKPMAG